MKRERNSKTAQAKPQSLQVPGWTTGAIVLVILTWTLISLYPSVNNGFTNWDDDTYVYKDTLIQHKSIAYKKIFSETVSNNYHPLTMLSLAMNYQAAGLKPAPYHWTNIIFHLFNTLLVFIFIYMLSGIIRLSSLPPPKQNSNPVLRYHQLIVASVVSLFFGIHPMHVESVTWVSERKDVLFTFFYAAALIVYLYHLKKPKAVTYISVFLLFILSCLSKGVAITLPVVMLLIDYFTTGKITRKMLIEKLPFLVVAIVDGIIAVRIQTSAMVYMNEINIMQRFFYASYGFIMYIVKMFVPFSLSNFYVYPALNDVMYVPPGYYVTPLIAAGLFLLALRAFPKEKWMLFGLLFYFITIAMVLQFISVGGVIIADRYTYVPYIGLYFIIGNVISYCMQLKSVAAKYLKITLPIGLCIYALILSGITHARAQVWKDSITLWDDAIKKYPADRLVRNDKNIVGWSKNEKDQFDLHHHLEMLVANAYNERALKRGADMKDYNGALNDCDVAISLHPHYVEAYGNRANAKNSLGDFQGARADYDRAIALDSGQAEMYNMRAHINESLNNYAEGIADYDKAINLAPDSADYYCNRGVLKVKLNKYEEAITDFTLTVKRNPQMALAYYNRAICESLLKRKSESCADLQKAFDLGYAKAEKDLCK